MQTKEVKERLKMSMKKKYGVENPVYLEFVQNKKQQTSLDKYGVPFPSQSSVVQEKIKQTCLERYGVEYAVQDETIRKQIVQTCLEKYGVKTTLLVPEVKEKIKQIQYEKFKQKLNKYLVELELELLDSNYIDCGHKHNWKCKKCGTEFEQSWNAIQQGYCCPKCVPRSLPYSKQEREIGDFIKSLGFEIIENDKKIIKPFELDIVIPAKKIAIEYDGLYWQNGDQIPKDYHLKKTELCEQHGYYLIHIFEDEWLLKKDIVKSRLKHILGATSDCIRIGARECNIREISTRIKNDFLDKYHIQGADNSVIKLGAFYNNKLVAVMTFSHGSLAKGRRKQNPLVWELNRFCINSGYIVSGIAGKMLSHFKNNYQWNKIYSYADRRWSQGNLYKNLGFRLDHTTKPNYWYLDGMKRIHRFNLRKRNNESKQIPEYILRIKEGYRIIWDCGNLLFSMEAL